MTRKLYIETVGCQMNVLDSELVVGSLRRHGYELTHEPTEADVILFNTCSVRQHAEDKIYSALGRLRPHKRRHPEKVIGVLGCMAQKDQEWVRQRAPHVDIVCGTGQLARLPELIAEVQRSGAPQLALSLDRKEASRHEVERSFESYDPLRVPLLEPSQPTQGGVNLILRVLADGAGVEQDQIGVGRRGRQFIAAPPQSAHDQFAVEDVHLAADGFDV